MGSPVQTMRQASAIMKDRPRVTSTWASSAPGSRRRINRSTIPPSAATSSPAATAAVQKSNPRASRREASGEQKEEAAERDAVDRQHEPQVHAELGGGRRGPLRISAADNRASTPAGRGTTSRRTSRTGSHSDTS